MKKKSMADIIAEQSFFQDIDPEYLSLFAGCASNKRFKEGEALFREGSESMFFYIIREGKVAIEVYTGAQGNVRIQTLGKGELLGWTWLVAPHECYFDALALKDTVTIALDGNCLRNKCQQDYKFGYEMLTRIVGVIVDRLRATRLQLIDMYQ